MNNFKIVTETIDSLWVWTYSVIAGSSLVFIVMTLAVIWLLIRQLKTERRLDRLESRLVHAERDYNLTIGKWNL